MKGGGASAGWEFRTGHSEMANASTFNQVLGEMLNALAHSFPHLPEFARLKSGLDLLVMTCDEDVALIAFRERVLTPEFADATFSRNDRFFLEAQGEPLPEIANAVGGSALCADFARQLRGLWAQLDADNRGVMWQYLTALVVLAQS